MINYRLLALKKMEQRGILEDLDILPGRKVLCYILGTIDDIQATYSSLRGNDLQAEFVRKPALHELLYVAEGLRVSNSVEKVTETVARYGKLLKFGPDDLTAIRKLASWPTEVLTKLTEVFKLYEKFQTSDAKELAKRQVSLIMEGQETVKVPHSLLRSIGMMLPHHFEQVSIQIVAKELSLRQAAEDASKLPKREQVMVYISQQIPGHLTSREIVTAYPGKFSNEVLDAFLGAIIGKKAVNEKGKALKEYVKGVVNGEESLGFQLMEIKRFEELDLSTLPECDTMVINCNTLSVDQVCQLRTLKAGKNSMSLVVLLSDQEEKTNLFCDLSTEMDNLKEIFFATNSPVKKGDFVQNLKLGIVSSSTIFKPPLKSFNGSINNLEVVVEQITPPGGKNVCITEGNIPIVSIHKTFSCQYFGEKAAVDKFNNNLKAGVMEFKPDEKVTVDNSDKDIPQMSDLNDSGIYENDTSRKDMEAAGPSRSVSEEEKLRVSKTEEFS